MKWGKILSRMNRCFAKWLIVLLSFAWDFGDAKISIHFFPLIYSVWSDVKFILNWKVKIYRALSIHVGECKILPQNFSLFFFSSLSLSNDRNNTGILIVLLKLASRIRAVTWSGSCTLLSAWMTHTITWSRRCHNLEKRKVIAQENLLGLTSLPYAVLGNMVTCKIHNCLPDSFITLGGVAPLDPNIELICLYWRVCPSLASVGPAIALGWAASRGRQPTLTFLPSRSPSWLWRNCERAKMNGKGSRITGSTVHLQVRTKLITLSKLLPHSPLTLTSPPFSPHSPFVLTSLLHSFFLSVSLSRPLEIFLVLQSKEVQLKRNNTVCNHLYHERWMRSECVNEIDNYLIASGVGNPDRQVFLTLWRRPANPPETRSTRTNPVWSCFSWEIADYFSKGQIDVFLFALFADGAYLYLCEPDSNQALHYCVHTVV